MARKNGSGKQQGGHNCGYCGGKGKVTVSVQRVEKGKTRTVTEKVDCTHCKGSGWVD